MENDQKNIINLDENEHLDKNEPLEEKTVELKKPIFVTKIVNRRSKDKYRRSKDKLYSGYQLSDIEKEDALYLAYCNVKNNETECRKFLIAQEEEFKKSKKDFPNWATYELKSLRLHKKLSNKQNNRLHPETKQNNNIKWNGLWSGLRKLEERGQINELGKEKLKKYRNIFNNSAKKHFEKKKKLELGIKEEVENPINDFVRIKEQKPQRKPIIGNKRKQYNPQRDVNVMLRKFTQGYSIGNKSKLSLKENAIDEEKSK